MSDNINPVKINVDKTTLLGHTEYTPYNPTYPIYPTQTPPTYNPKPYTCPVCGGNRLVQNGFYNQFGGKWSSTNVEFEKCRSCNGKGIIWG